MEYGRAIELFLVNGTADSLITAELSNWNGKAIKILRTELSDHTVPSFQQRGKSYYDLRNTLVSNGTITDRVFTKDYEAKAPSAASAVILGRTSNGNIDWKTAEGKELKYL